VTARIRFFAVILFASVLNAQTAPPDTSPTSKKDPRGRDTPQSAIFQFLEACHAQDYGRALHYLDLRGMTPAKRASEGPNLARQLEDLLDDTPFDLATLSREADGDLSDGLPMAQDHLYSFKIGQQSLELRLERVTLKTGSKVWLVSADSVTLIPRAHQLIAESPFEKDLPQWLVTTELLETPVWRWIALAAAAILLWLATGLLVWGLSAAIRTVSKLAGFGIPLRIVLTVTGLRIAIELAPPAVLSRLFLERSLAMILSLALAWAGAVAIDIVSDRWNLRLDPRVQVMTYSVLPLGRQILKLSLFLVAILSVVSAWGYNTSTILAGLGVGGLAIALAAQKTIENLFGGISVIGDRPVLVGDVCRFGDRTGTVMHIGLRSTRIRTTDRTVISVPNAQFSSVPLENISSRDKILFHPTLSLRRDTSSAQLLEVLASAGQLLKSNPKVEPGPMPVRFVGVGQYSLDLEVLVYIVTTDYNEFLGVQQELLIQLIQAIEKTGSALALPVQESVDRAAPDGTAKR
jgi:MscS family membrane protein